MYARQLLATGLALFASVANGAEDNTVLWKNVGNWSVAADKNLGGACFVATTFVSGVGLRLGFNAKGAPSPVHILIASADWASIEAQKDYDVSLQLDNNAFWNATAIGTELGAVKGLWVNTDQVQFLTEFVKKRYLKVYFNQKLIASMSLQGSGAATTELANCQKAVDAVGASAAPPPKDPFSVPNATPDKKDPFAL